MTKRERRTFTEDFKQQIVQLYQNGKPRKEIIREYDLTPSSLDKWVSQSQKSGSFKEKDNLTDEQKELMELRKRNKQLEMENDIFKASRADTRTKVNVIKNNQHKYSISAMCKVLQIPRSTYYYEAKERVSEDPVTSDVIDIFHASRQNYGTRKIKVELKKRGHIVSRRRIGRIMQEQGLVSSYTIAQFKPHTKSCNESEQTNELNRAFAQEQEMTTIVSDLTYVRVNQKWNYVCVFVDLFNREIVGFSTGPNKDALLVYRALASIKVDLNKIQLFHTDRGNEFKNNLIDDALKTFNIQRSLSMKGCPYDNAVAEATFKIIKTEFVKGRHFSSLEELTRELKDYVHWFNSIRIHGTLGYESPIEYKHRHLKKIV
ncbi:IS3 family transposase [Lysinibacillus sp. FSL K6-0232]|nr:IS3 family transposase [Lysinibacillus macroides]QPR67868.1 IS3 family transposase [Lysinibacillus macroides]QPR69287.1 IS3 family transposase [Lysinibacillus macroides]QPR69491.1 IS3 family transposase [Lysinibacillus macroides]